METKRQTLRVRVDWYTRTCLTAIAVLLTVLVIGLWADHAPRGPEAQAAKPFVESGTQVQIVQLVRAQDRTTAKISELIALLRSGQVKVDLVGGEGRSSGGKSNGSNTTPK